MSLTSSTPSPWRLSVAPMMDWTDRHCRYLHRLLSKHTLLYTEMVTTGALMHGSVQRHLRFNAEEHPVALQLGGSDAKELAEAARMGEQWGYDEINLNCGCPSDRVQRGAFGACLMAEPRTVAEGVKAMVDAVSIPVTVMHRIGIDRVESYDFVRDFVGTVSEAGCSVFMVHARNAWLDALSPTENREVPPLRYEVVERLKRERPDLVLVLNGGLVDLAACEAALGWADGVMLGRAAYQEPWLLADVDRRLFGEDGPAASRAEVVEGLVALAERMQAEGRPLKWLARHTLGLMNGLPGARAWRRVLSEGMHDPAAGPALFRQAAARVALQEGFEAAA